MMSEKIVSDNALEIIFKEARTYGTWKDKEVSDTLIKAVYDLTRMGSTAANCCPARFVVIKSQEAKEKLKQALSEGNIEKTMKAPATVIVAQDMEFYEKLPQLFPHADARSWYIGNEKLIEETAFRNSSLQGAYFMLAARALGLDCGPMSGFDGAKLDHLFFEGTKFKTNFICNIGYGDQSNLRPRLPRLNFDEACSIL